MPIQAKPNPENASWQQQQQAEADEWSTHCLKSSFFVQKFNFDFPEKIVDFSRGEKLVKMLGICTF